MNAQAAQLYEKALALPEADRAALAEKLYASVDQGFDPEVEEAWSEEIKRRMEEIDSGKVKMIPGEQVLQKLQAKLDRARNA